MTVNAPEINLNEYKNTQKKITTFSFNLSKIPKTTILEMKNERKKLKLDSHIYKLRHIYVWFHHVVIIDVHKCIMNANNHELKQLRPEDEHRTHGITIRLDMISFNTCKMIYRSYYWVQSSSALLQTKTNVSVIHVGKMNEHMDANLDCKSKKTI